jgi:hypothetical protein
MKCWVLSAVVWVGVPVVAQENPLGAPRNPLGSAAENPLGAPAVNPLGAEANGEKPTAPAAVDVAGGQAERWGVVHATRTGRTLFQAREDARSARGLLAEAVKDVAAYLGVKPSVTGAFADVKDLRGGARFSATVNGTALKGAIFVGIGERGGAVTAVIDVADAPRQSLAALAAAVPQPLVWEDARLPDGSGTLRLPRGWRITGAANGAVDVVGPEGQQIDLGIAFPVNSPQAEQAWMQSQIAAGIRPTPSGQIVAPIPRDCVEAVRGMVPVMNRAAAAKGGPQTELVSVAPIEGMPNTAASAALHIVADIGDGRNKVRTHSMAHVQVSAIGDGRWLFYYSTVAAPEAIFARDVPVMAQIWASWKVSDAVLRERLAKAAESVRGTNALVAERAAERRRPGRYDDPEKVRDAANADFSEVIRGYRTVEDTRTGERREADLGRVDDIVLKMNEKEGYERYKPIPLREQ